MDSLLRQEMLNHCPAVLAPHGAELTFILAEKSGLSSSGFPFLAQQAWERLRDRIPILLGHGHRTLCLLENLLKEMEACTLTDTQKENVERAAKVVKQVILTASITAPPDLWLLYHVLGTFQHLGLLTRLREGEAIYPESCYVQKDGVPTKLSSKELNTDLRFLLSRGLIEEYANSYRMAGHPRALEIFSQFPKDIPASQCHPTDEWRRFFAGEHLSKSAEEELLHKPAICRLTESSIQTHWIPAIEEIQLGAALVPLVLAMRASHMTARLSKGTVISRDDWTQHHPQIGKRAINILNQAGWVTRSPQAYTVTTIGERGFSRGPGPFGIIETYHPYMRQLESILVQDASQVWVSRGENVGASQDANKKTFQTANTALDRFCADTGFSFDVFIEHAIGRGEATRQRYQQDGNDRIQYFGADLEDDAIDAALEEQQAGNLPNDMIFVRQADIGSPDTLIHAIREAGAQSNGAVMLVGNGFHEVRQQTDNGMREIFAKYHDAGIILLFTEENALSIDDLRATAWNTYHAGFKYVHEKSGQGLRPAYPRPPNKLGSPLRASWSTCAQHAGYFKAENYCTKTRTVYPYPPANQVNPSISVNHFFVPGPIAERLGLTPDD